MKYNDNNIFKLRTTALMKVNYNSGYRKNSQLSEPSTSIYTAFILSADPKQKKGVTSLKKIVSPLNHPTQPSYSPGN